MTLKTNLNSAPYYDDFDSSDNFHRVLFRPGYAIQARELTQLQSILQDQIEKHGNHIFQDGAIVIPGNVFFNNQYVSIRLKPTFGGESIDQHSIIMQLTWLRLLVKHQESLLKLLVTHKQLKMQQNHFYI